MAQNNFSTKRVQISKANLMIVIVVSVACFLTIFSLVASKALLQQRAYQAKVISLKTKARDQLKQNLTARDQLVAQYKVFAAKDPNIIGGNATGTGDKDGDNAKIVLDALPSQYDYPALATSLEKLMTDSGLTIRNISGTDDEVNQATVGAQATPTPVAMPFQIAFDGDSGKTQNFLTLLGHSIRPIQVQTVTITGNDSQLSTDMTAQTFYQPEKSLSIKSEVVK